MENKLWNYRENKYIFKWYTLEALGDNDKKPTEKTYKILVAPAGDVLKYNDKVTVDVLTGGLKLKQPA